MRSRSALHLCAAFATIFVFGCQSESTSTEKAESISTVQRPNGEPAGAWIASPQLGVRVDKFGLAVADRAFHVRGYQAGGEEKILALPNPLTQTFSVDGTPIPVNEMKAVSQTFNPEKLELVSVWTWKNLEFEVRHRGEPEQLVERITVKTTENINSLIRSRTEGLRLEGNNATFYNIRLAEDDPLVAVQVEESVVGIESTGSSQVNTGSVERAANVGPSGVATFERIFRVENAPSNFPPPKFRVQIEGNAEDEATVNRLAALLQMGVTSTGQVGPMGLSSATYNGHVFWDSDIWMFPALALIEPNRARALARYRLDKFAQAKQNYSEWIKAGRPTQSGKVGGTVPPGVGAKFPWESSVSGRETVPGPSRFQDHATGSVAFGLHLAGQLGILADTQVAPVLAAAKTFYLARSENGADGRVLKDTMSPDEHHTGDNDLYTNILAEWLTGEPFQMPQDENGLITYDKDALKGYKQAAAVLAIYPLQYPTAERQAETMMERFADKVIKSGPAMTDSVHATIAARLGDPERAYETWRKQLTEFTEPTSGLFSEKRNQSRTVFLTGIGGSLQTVLYGFAGFRIDEGTNEFSRKPKYTTRLKSGARLTITPSLPPSWKKLTLNPVYWDGKAHSVTITGDSVTVQ